MKELVILADGLGTQLSKESRHTAMPLVQNGGRPIMWHIY